MGLECKLDLHVTAWPDTNVDYRLFFERDFVLSMVPDAAIDRFPMLQKLTKTQGDLDRKKKL